MSQSGHAKAVEPPPKTFWQQVVRRRVTPLYRHPVLVPRGSAHGLFIDPDDGSITDGDDNLWSGDVRLLEHGRWREIFGGPRRNGTGSDQQPKGDAVTNAATASPHDHDDRLTLPPPNMPEYEGGVSDDEDERELEEAAENSRNLARRLREAADLIDEQNNLPLEKKKLFVLGLKRKNVGRDVVRLADDMRHAKSTGRTRDTTWTSTKAPPRKRQRTANLMGYHPSSSPAPSTRAPSNAPPSSPPRAPSIIDIDQLDSDDFQLS